MGLIARMKAALSLEPEADPYQYWKSISLANQNPDELEQEFVRRTQNFQIIPYLPTNMISEAAQETAWSQWKQEHLRRIADEVAHKFACRKLGTPE